MLRAEADRLRNNFAAYKKSREEVNLTESRLNEAIRHPSEMNVAPKFRMNHFQN